MLVPEKCAELDVLAFKSLNWSDSDIPPTIPELFGAARSWLVLNFDCCQD
jgi:hypothetical protein